MWSKYELLFVAKLVYRFAHFVTNRGVLSFQVQQGHLHRSSPQAPRHVSELRMRNYNPLWNHYDISVLELNIVHKILPLQECFVVKGKSLNSVFALPGDRDALNFGRLGGASCTRQKFHYC